WAAAQSQVRLPVQQRESLDRRRWQLDDQPALPARPQPLLETGDAPGLLPRRERELRTGAVQCIEQMEQLFLRALGLRERVHVVDQQHLRPPVAAAPTVHTVVLERLDQLG